ncbi:MAG: Omp28-related outer membrane protein [Bacteroidales bacterium]|nr:Omp28-related outer membrane protein [Bacteroidales bacterium]
MKLKISLVFLTTVFSFILWTACDKIEDPLKITDQKDYPLNPDDTLFFVDSVLVQNKQVLLEDFTGHKCVNCPKAAKELHEMMEELHPSLVSYTVHAGNFAVPSPGTVFSTDLRSPLSERLFTEFGIFANPIAMIDRVEYNGLRQVFTTSWNTVVTQQLQTPNTANLKLKNIYFPKLDIVVIDVDVEFLSALEGQYNLVVYLVEDGIVSPQLNNDPTIGPDTLMNFVHHNVLRGAVNAAYGDPINLSGNIVSGQTFTKRYTYQINPDWVTENCRIIAYIGKSDDALNLIDIIQVAELGIKTEE